MKDLDPKQMGIAYDIRHAMVEGSSAWPVSFQLVSPLDSGRLREGFCLRRSQAKERPHGKGHCRLQLFSDTPKVQLSRSHFHSRALFAS